MIKIRVLKRIITFLLLASLIFTVAGFSVNEPGDYFLEANSENQPTDLSQTNSCLYRSPLIVKNLDALANHQVLYKSAETTQRFIGRGNNSQRLTYILTPLLNYAPDMPYSQDFYNVIPSGKSRLSVLALSLGGNSPPVTHI